MVIELPGNPNIDPDEEYKFEFVNIPKEVEKVVQRSLVIAPVKNKVSSPGESVIFNAKFQPLKPFKSILEFAILKVTGGRWKYKIHLESTTPDPDDTIYLTAPLGKTTSVAFRLTNITKMATEFQGDFTPESDSEFSVLPKTGLLDALGKDGTQFIVSFTPVEYGKMKLGKLIVQTDEMYWSYVVKGNFPKYIPPVGKASINNKLSDDVEKKLGSKTQKNFMKENILKSNSPRRDQGNSPRDPSPPKESQR